MSSLFNGRLGRGAFITSIIGTGFFSIIPLSLIQTEGDLVAKLFGAVLGIFNLVLIISVYVRRLHDLNKSWHWILFFTLPIINLVGFAILIIIPGDKKSNKYGPPPHNVLF